MLPGEALEPLLPQLHLLVSLPGTEHPVGHVTAALHMNHLENQGELGFVGLLPLPFLPQEKKPPWWMAPGGWDDKGTRGKGGGPAELTAALCVC